MVSKIETRSVVCGNLTIEYQLTRKAVKNVNLRIKPDGRITVSANRGVPVTFIDAFVRKKQEFIIQALERYEEIRKDTSEAPLRYVSGEAFDFLGKSLLLKVMEGKRESAWSDGEFIYLLVKDKDNEKRKEKLLNDWLQNQRWEIFSQICGDTYQIMKKYNVPDPQLKIRRMTSCWGSCRPKGGIITLNSRLIEAPRSSIEYVVLHEFVHFIHPNHSRQFYDFVAMLMPDWKERKMRLEKR